MYTAVGVTTVRPRLCCASRDAVALGLRNKVPRQSNTDEHWTVKTSQGVVITVQRSHIYLDIMALGLVNNVTRNEREELHADILNAVFLLCVVIFRAILSPLFDFCYSFECLNVL